MTTQSTAGESGLIRALGMWGLAAGIFNVTVGGGIFRLPSNPAVAGVLGPAAPLAYVVCGVVMGLIVLCFAEAGSRVRMTGGPYAYVEIAFGPFVGFLMGVLMWLLGTTAMAAVADVFATNVLRLWPAAEALGGKTMLIVATLGGLTAINIFGVKQGTNLNTATSIAKLVPLVLLLAVGVFAVQPARLAIHTMPSGADLSRASIVLFFAYSGVESALVPSGEVKDSARTVPRAVLLAMVFVMLLYIALQLVAQGILGDALVTSKTPLADAAEVVMGPWGKLMLLVGVIVSTFGYMSGMTLAVPRALFAFARDGFLPKQMAAIHPKFRTPWIALIVQSSTVMALSVLNGFDSLAVISNVAALLLYAACCMAAWKLRRMNVQLEEKPFTVPGGAVVPILGVVLIIGLLSSVTPEEWKVLAAVIGVAIAIFFMTAKSRKSNATSDAVAIEAAA
jgi:amino acid transporter